MKRLLALVLLARVVLVLGLALVADKLAARADLECRWKDLDLALLTGRGELRGFELAPRSGGRAHEPLLALEYGVEGRLLFGSDWPFTTPAETIDELRRINRFTEGTALPRVPEAVIEAIVERDSLSLLGLS